MNGIESASSVARFLVLAYRIEVYRRAKTCALRLARKLTIASSSPFPSYRPQARNDNPPQDLNERQNSVEELAKSFCVKCSRRSPLLRRLADANEPLSVSEALPGGGDNISAASGAGSAYEYWWVRHDSNLQPDRYERLKPEADV